MTGVATQDAMADVTDGMRRAMRGLAQSVCVISTVHDGARIAMAATAVNSLSFDPPAMVVAINRSASIFAAMRSGADFCINVLSEGQADIATACSGQLKGEDRFGVGTWDQIGSVPALVGAQARLFCRQDGFVSYGTHGVFIGRVLAVEVEDRVAPLLYADGAFRRLPV